MFLINKIHLVAFACALCLLCPRHTHPSRPVLHPLVLTWSQSLGANSPPLFDSGRWCHSDGPLEAHIPNTRHPQAQEAQGSQVDPPPLSPGTEGGRAGPGSPEQEAGCLHHKQRLRGDLLRQGGADAQVPSCVFALVPGALSAPAAQGCPVPLVSPMCSAWGWRARLSPRCQGAAWRAVPR